MAGLEGSGHPGVLKRSIALPQCSAASPVRPVDLPEDVSCVNEEHSVLAVGFLLSLVEKPERAWQRDGVEEVRTDRHDHVD